MVGVRRGAVRSPPLLSISLWGTRYLEQQCTSILSQTGTPKVTLVGRWLPLCIPELHPQNRCHFAWHPSGWMSQTFWSIYFSHMPAATMYADKYGHIHHPECRNTLISMHMTLCTLPTRDISLGSLMLPAPKVGDCRFTPAIPNIKILLFWEVQRGWNTQLPSSLA